MNKRLALLAGAGVGAGVMFLLDPDRGKRRRALLRDKAIHLSRVGSCTVGKISRDVRNRAVGVVSEIRASLKEGGVPDSVLVDRVKARLGRYPVHDRSIAVTADNGTITLKGHVLANEVDTLLSAVSAVRGVKNVINELVVHESSEGISSLQGRPVGANA
jgi:osmotically-inducible protein OsmY